MLNCTRNSHCNIQFRRNNFAGLSDLAVIGRIFRINGGAAGSDCGTQNIGQRRQYCVKLLRTAQCTAAGHDNTRLRQFRPVRLCEFA